MYRKKINKINDKNCVPQHVLESVADKWNYLWLERDTKNIKQYIKDSDT